MDNLSIGTIISSTLGTNRNNTQIVRLLQVEISSTQDVQTVELIQDFGSDYAPVPGSRVLIGQVGNAWKIAFAGQEALDLTEDLDTGARLIYSLNEDGTVRVAQINLSNEGVIEISNTSNNLISLNIDDSIQITNSNTGVDIQLTSDGKVLIGNTAEDLATLISDLIDVIIGLTTFGSPTNHSLSPATQSQLNAISVRFLTLLTS